MAEDRRDPPTRRLLMVRHGHYERTGDLGDEVWGLSPLGRRQAARTARRLSRLVSTYPGQFEGVYSSPWPRAVQTAEIAAHELDLDTVRLKKYLHECVPLINDEAARHHPHLRATGDPERQATVEQVRRVKSRFFVASKKDSTYLVFAHGNLIRYLVADALGLPYEAWMHMECHHASITEMRVYPGGFTALIRYNDTGHLPPSMVTST